MKSLLMHRDRDFLALADIPREARYRDYVRPKLSPDAQAMMQDLEVEVVLRAMAADDPFLLEVGRKALLSGVTNDKDTILYRQAIIRDSLKNPTVIRELYVLTVETIEGKKKHWWGLSSHLAGSILHSSVELMEMFVGMLRKLRNLADSHSSQFDSEGFRTLFATLDRELSDEYFTTVGECLGELKFRDGTLETAQLGEGNAGAGYVLRQPPEKITWFKRILGRGPPGYTFHLHPRDEVGPRIVSEMRDRGTNTVANALAQSTDHVLSFFEMLRVELAFYVGCLNLHDTLAAMGAATCFPETLDLGARRHAFQELYDISLALTMRRRIVGNAVDADGKSLVIITGANQGGKSSFLRSIGLAQLMLQAGMFVGGESFSGELCSGIYTHYKREEDATMEKGKFDEEVSRMSDVVDVIRPHALMLFNESFASTNEREGSEVARQVVGALLERNVKVFFVTHLYDFAHGIFARNVPEALFLRADRQPDGTRTFKLVEGEPRSTSYGEDLYEEVFGSDAPQRWDAERAKRPSTVAPADSVRSA